MLAYGMNGEDLPLLNGFPLRLVVPGYYGTYWVKHLNEITVLDNVFDGFWMKSAYRIPDTPNNCDRARHRAEGDDPDQPLHHPLLHHQLPDGAKLKAGGTTLRGIAFDGGNGIKEVAVSTDGGKTWTNAKLGKDLGNYSFREWTLPVKLAAGAHELKVRATGNGGETQPDDAALESGGLHAQRRRNRPRHRGLRRMIMQRTALLAISLALSAARQCRRSPRPSTTSSRTRSPPSSPAPISKSCRAIAAPATRPTTSTRSRR